MVRNGLKYQRIDVAAREQARREWNRPVRWPLVLAAAALVIFVFPAIRFWRRHESATARDA